MEFKKYRIMKQRDFATRRHSVQASYRGVGLKQVLDFIWGVTAREGAYGKDKKVA